MHSAEDSAGWRKGQCGREMGPDRVGLLVLLNSVFKGSLCVDLV